MQHYFMNIYCDINTRIHNYNNITYWFNDVIHLTCLLCLSKFTCLSQNPAVNKRLTSALFSSSFLSYYQTV